jgi:hypothetical protein
MTDTRNETTNIGLDRVGESIDQILESANHKMDDEINTAVATKEEIEKVIENLITTKKLPKTQTNFNRILVTTAHLVQIGATSPKFAATRIVSDYGIDIKVGDLRDACSRTNITVRKYARGIRNTVIKVAQRHNIEGNLSKGYKLENPNFDKQDLIWVSDFQTFSENPSMPEEVRTWLLENYKNRFRPNN